jgi:hypothetical protein
MEWLLGAIIISVFVAIFLQRYYYTSSIITQINRKGHKQKKITNIFKPSLIKFILAFILIELEYYIFNIFYFKYTGTYHYLPPGFQQDPNNFLWIIDSIFILLPYPVSCFVASTFMKRKKGM